MLTNRLILFLFCIIFSTTIAAVTRKVTPSDKLQLVLDKAAPGDTILVGKGIYKQQKIAVKKKLYIIGEEYPVFDGEKKDELFTIAADGVVIRGLQIQNTGKSSLVDMAGIKMQDVKNVHVSQCKILNTTYAIHIQNSSKCTVSNNIIKSSAKSELQSGNGVHAWKCSELFINNNTISGHRDGIYFEFVTHSKISRNISSNNVRYGLHFMFSHNDIYEYNTFKYNGAGVAVMYTKGVTMYKNVFYHNWGDASYGILLKDITDSKIEHNKFNKNTIGIYMEGSSRIYVSGNEFTSNGWAMRIQASCDNNVFEKNNFLGNSFDVATNGTMMLNTFTGNYWDKYDGYDLDRNGVGDVPYYPVSIYSVITERIPTAMILYRSLLTNIMDRVENVMPSITPDQLKDTGPRTKKWKL